jgi:hypothetical protein
MIGTSTKKLVFACFCPRSSEAQLEEVVEERDKLLPQLEQAKWGARQLEKRLEEAVGAGREVAKVREV